MAARDDVIAATIRRRALAPPDWVCHYSGGAGSRRRSNTAERRNMAHRYRSEIRDSTIRDLLERVRKQSFGRYVRRIRLNKVRAFQIQEVGLDFPVTALIGTNGGGKSTILGCAAMAYKSTKPATFFPSNPAIVCSNVSDLCLKLSDMCRWSSVCDRLP